MKGNDWHVSNTIDAGVGPRAWGQVGYGADVEVVAKGGLGGFSRLNGLTGEGEDDLIDEFGARQPVEVCDSTQDGGGKRLVVIQKTADGGAVERIVAQCLGDGARDGPTANDEDPASFCFAAAPSPHNLPEPAQQREPGQAAGKYSGGGQRSHSVPCRDEDQADGEQK